MRKVKPPPPPQQITAPKIIVFSNMAFYFVALLFPRHLLGTQVQSFANLTVNQAVGSDKGVRATASTPGAQVQSMPLARRGIAFNPIERHNQAQWP